MISGCTLNMAHSTSEKYPCGASCINYSCQITSVQEVAYITLVSYNWKDHVFLLFSFLTFFFFLNCWQAISKKEALMFLTNETNSKMFFNYTYMSNCRTKLLITVGQPKWRQAQLLVFDIGMRCPIYNIPRYSNKISNTASVRSYAQIYFKKPSKKHFFISH